MIRFATEDDIQTCVDMGRQFVSEAGMKEIPFDFASAEATIRHLTFSEECCLLVAEDESGVYGMAGAVSNPHFMNHEVRAAQEIFWWLKPEKRGGMAGVRLLSGLESWARDLGCKTLTMICLPIDSPAETIYARAGYRPLERGYIKEV